MPNDLALEFRSTLNALGAELSALPSKLADKPWREGGWTRRQIVGHLLDSATNNRQRFVRASIDGSYVGPGYQQEPWVAAHGYAEQNWETLVRWWLVEHEILVAVVDHIPEERLEAPCVLRGEAPVTLRFVIADYLRHQRWHFQQLMVSIAL